LGGGLPRKADPVRSAKGEGDSSAKKHKFRGFLAFVAERYLLQEFMSLRKLTFLKKKRRECLRGETAVPWGEQSGNEKRGVECLLTKKFPVSIEKREREEKSEHKNLRGADATDKRPRRCSRDCICHQRRTGPKENMPTEPPRGSRSRSIPGRRKTRGGG